MEVYVIRHTSVDVEQGICYGQLDVPLAPSFESEKAIVQTKLPIDIDIVYSSPLSRCVLLAQSLGYKNIQFEDALLEVNFGDWEGKKWSEINKEKLEKWMLNFVTAKPPLGESLEELFERTKLFLEKLRDANHQKVLLVSHAGFIRCVWAYLLEIPLQNILKIPVGYGDVLSFNLGVEPMFDTIMSTK
jgi:alpha-ribazole phosphatase